MRYSIHIVQQLSLSVSLHILVAGPIDFADCSALSAMLVKAEELAVNEMRYTYAYEIFKSRDGISSYCYTLFVFIQLFE